MNKEKILKLAKGYRGRGKNCYRIAKQRVQKALLYQYRDRRTKKRDMRSLWIQKINAAVKPYNQNYSRFIHGLGKHNIALNRNILSELAVYEPRSFGVLVEESMRQAPPLNETAAPTFWP